MTLEPRPKRYPPPEFPPRRAKLFAKTPPAVFPSILGLLGLGMPGAAWPQLLMWHWCWRYWRQPHRLHWSSI